MELQKGAQMTLSGRRMGKKLESEGGWAKEVSMDQALKKLVQPAKNYTFYS